MKEQTSTSKHETSIAILRVLTGGTALGLSFLPAPLWFLAWIALVPLLLIWASNRSWVRFLAEVYTAFLIAYALGLFWPMLHVFSQAATLAFGGLLLIPLLWTIPFAASRFFLRRYGRPVGFGSFVALFLSVEMLLLHGPIQFPWPVLGTTQADAVLLVQFVEYTGVLGLTLWVLLLNGLFFFATLKSRRRTPQILCGVAMVILFCASFAFSTWRLNQLEQDDHYITVGIIQPAMDRSAWIDQRGANRLLRLTALSDSLVNAMNAPPVFMIWPEQAVPAPFNRVRQRFVDAQLQRWSERLEIALLSGALVPSGEPGRTDHFYNSAILYRPRTTPLRYDQVRYTPFQTRVPFSDYVPLSSVGAQPTFATGRGQDRLSFDNIKVGILLDFEILLGHYARRHPAEGAEFLVGLSRQEHWGEDPVAFDHLRFARLRAMESRRSVVRVSANGQSAVIAPNGRALLKSPSGQTSARLAAVPLHTGTTVYSRYGDVIGWAAMVPAGMFFLFLMLGATWHAMKYTGAALAWLEEEPA